MELYKEKFSKAFKDNSGRFFTNVKNRFLAAFLVYPPYGTYEESSIVKTFIHALPCLSIIYILVCMGSFVPGYMKIGIFIYIIYLLPYIVVNYYIRYSIPLTLFKVLFIFWGMDCLIARYRILRRAKSG